MGWLSFGVLVSAGALGGFVVLFPRFAVELQVQMHRNLKWKLESKTIERETLRMRFFGIVMAMGAMVGLFFAANMSNIIQALIESSHAP